ncbi:ACT domain-containing protein [Nocardia sp. BMG51109]|uniref:ACT domain-containing protein n=1 Tax=Nocardia sp. BMG51109 TaxID=1056816 RepID=UPI000462FC3B|nr:ACT domain-containing protein [Nocardia sp. BMG51109]
MTKSQRLHIVPSRFAVEHLPAATFPEDDEWIALVRAPEGLTLVREAPPWEQGDVWVGFYAGTGGPGLDDSQALAALVNPLADASIPVFAASTYHADLVLVPERRQEEAAAALREAGHDITE